MPLGRLNFRLQELDQNGIEARVGGQVAKFRHRLAGLVQFRSFAGVVQLVLALLNPITSQGPQQLPSLRRLFNSLLQSLDRLFAIHQGLGGVLFRLGGVLLRLGGGPLQQEPHEFQFETGPSRHQNAPDQP